MANKSVIILQADKFDSKASDEATVKFMKKAVVFENYKGGDISELSQIENCKECAIDAFSREFLDENNVVLIKLEDANKAFAKLDEIAGRSTLSVVVSKDIVVMEGLAINGKIGKVEREVFAKDLAPTICYIVDAELPPNPMGAIIYQALKEPSLKAIEVRKAEQAIVSLESAIERKSRNPWDKHDCA